MSSRCSRRGLISALRIGDGSLPAGCRDDSRFWTVKACRRFLSVLTPILVGSIAMASCSRPPKLACDPKAVRVRVADTLWRFPSPMPSLPEETYRLGARQSVCPPAGATEVSTPIVSVIGVTEHTGEDRVPGGMQVILRATPDAARQVADRPALPGPGVAVADPAAAAVGLRRHDIGSLQIYEPVGRPKTFDKIICGQPDPRPEPMSHRTCYGFFAVSPKTEVEVRFSEPWWPLAQSQRVFDRIQVYLAHIQIKGES
jgi:hypothetical protein